MPTISTLTVDVVTRHTAFLKGIGIIGTAVAAAGVLVGKLALDYDDAFTKIAAVSNASAKDIEKWRGQVLDLAGATAQAPKELADALFFLASAGLKSSQIMPALEASAKASAVGLGETADIARVTANVLNAYAGTGLRAANVMDVLVAAVREGTADTDEFSGALGRILPIASTAGVSFDSVAASLASLSNVGLDVNEGVTAMRGLLQALVAPGTQAAQAMKQMGLNADELLTSLQEQGLLGTVRMLDRAVRAGTTSQAEYMNIMRMIVPNVRALTGALGLTTQEAEKMDGIFMRVRESTGSLNQAMAETSETAGFKFRQALAELAAVGIRIGDVLLPVLAAVASFLTDNVGPAIAAVVEWFQKMWARVKPVADAIGAVLMPALMAAWHAVRDRLVPALERLWEAFGPILKVAALAAAVFGTLIVGQILILITVLSHLIAAFARVVDWVRENLAEPIVGAIQRIIEWLQRAAEWVSQKFGAAWQAIKGPVLAVIGIITTAVEALTTAIEFAVDALAALKPGPGTIEVAPQTGGFHGLPRPPEAQTGGFVARSGLAVIHRGETVVPAGGGGITINVQGWVGDEAALTRKIEEMLNRNGRRNGGRTLAGTT